MHMQAPFWQKNALSDKKEYIHRSEMESILINLRGKIIAERQAEMEERNNLKKQTNKMIGSRVNHDSHRFAV